MATAGDGLRPEVTMSSASRKRGRTTRIVAIDLPPGRIARTWAAARNVEVLGRVALCVVAALALWGITQGWKPPFVHRVGQTPPGDVRARVNFSVPLPTAQRTDDDAGNSDVTEYAVGQSLASADIPLTTETVQLLRREHDAMVASLPAVRLAERGLAVLGFLAALFAWSGYVIWKRDRRLIVEWWRLSTLIVVAVVGVSAAYWASADPWRAEVVPLLVCGMTFGIAYPRDVALALVLSMTTTVALASGQGLGEWIFLAGIVTTAVVQIGSIRGRSRLITVGFVTGIVAFVVTLGVGLLDSQPMNWPLLNLAVRNAAWTFVASFLMTGLLPFVERWFGVLTDLSLLEMGDVAHPLLQELVRRAPGTYNHSITVGSIAEAAAESIGARGLLVRIGAYFHDIGKMLKPWYFAENQGPDGNRHDSLAPELSTLIIIAHIKDGAELARKHHLPQPIIDFIVEHHGTTLIEYFYHRAAERSEAADNGDTVHESSFRYPGPKPRTVEAAVLMLSDAVESACRTLVEPTPSRIENVVEEIAMKRLLDGQFDECGLTLKQLRLIEDSLVKSLSAVYHGRVKYPEAKVAAR